MYNKRIVAIDSQKLDSIESCMFQYKLKFGTLTEPGNTPLVVPDYFERGGLLHDMLEYYYKLKAHKSRWMQNKRTHQDIVNSCVIIGRHRAMKMQLDIAEVETVISTFLQYTDFWENDDWNDVVAVERVGSKILYDSPDLCILYEFKVDLILRIAGQITPIDHKSSKSRRDPNSLSNQFRGYCWGLGCNRLLVNEIGYQRTLKPSEKFRRHTLSFSDSMLKEWQDNAIYWVRHALTCIDADFYPHNFTSCDKYSGCLYKPTICSADPEVREYKLQQFFQNKTWDVGKDHL